MKGKYGYLMGAAVAAAMTFGAAQADAAAISGDFSFSGAFAPVGSNSLTGATGINFTTDSFEVDGDAFGTFALFINDGDIGDIKDFSFNPFAAVLGFIEIAGFSFDLTTIDVGTVIVGPLGAQTLSMSGTGTISKAGYDSSTAAVVLTFNQGTRSFSFSGSTLAVESVPAPAAIGLLGLGLIGLGAAARRRNA